MSADRFCWTWLGLVALVSAAACGGGDGGPAAAADAAGGAADASFDGSPDASPPRISVDPTISSNPAVPLAPLVRFTTDVPTRASLEVGDGTRTFAVRFDALEQVHAHPLLGLKPGRVHTIDLEVADAMGVKARAASLSFTTAPLPLDFPPIVVTRSDPAAMEPGVTFLSAFPRGPGVTYPAIHYLLAIDAAGDVVWYYGRPDYIGDARRTSRGTLLYGDREMSTVEIDMAGTLLRRWHASAIHAPPAGAIPVDIDSMHHESFEMSSGNLLVLSSEMRHYDAWPTSETNPSAPLGPADVVGDVVVELRTDGTVVDSWRLLDVLDPLRIGYNSRNGFWNPHYDPVALQTRDWSHANAVVHDPGDNSILVSVRHQDAVIKLRRATGELVWILGPHDNWRAPWKSKLLTPQGGMEWPFHTHASKVLPNGNILLFDNGTFRASPPAAKLPATQNYSRAVEYRVDEGTMTVAEVWSYGGPGGEIFYSPFICDADRLPQTGNVLVTDGGRVVDEAGAPSDDLSAGHRFARIVEVTHTIPPVKVWEVTVGNLSAASPVGWLVYRSMRLPGLYP